MNREQLIAFHKMLHAENVVHYINEEWTRHSDGPDSVDSYLLSGLKKDVHKKECFRQFGLVFQKGDLLANACIVASV